MASTYIPQSAERKLTLTLGAVFALRMFGLFMLLPVFSVVGLSLEGSTPALVGTALGIYGLTQAILQIPFGALSDRFGRRPLMVAGLLLFILGGVVAACSSSIWGVIIGRALQGAGAISSVIMALLSDRIEESRRPKALAMVGMSIGATFVLSLLLGPQLVAWVGLAGLFWVSVLLGIGALLLTVFAVPASQPVQRHHAPGGVARFRQALANPDLWVLNTGIFALHLVLTGLFVLLPRQLVDTFGLPVHQHSWLYLLAIVLSIPLFLPLVISAKRRTTRSLFLMATALLAAGLLLLLLPQAGIWGIGAGLVIFFAGFNALEALLPSQVGSAAPVITRGTAMGIYSSLQFLGVFLGAQLAGWLAPELGFRLMIGLMIVVMCLWSVWVLSRPSLKRLTLRYVVTDAVASRGGNNLLTDEWLQSLLNIRGVEEVVLVASEQLVMLKVDDTVLDEAALQQCIASVKQTQV